MPNQPPYYPASHPPPANPPLPPHPPQPPSQPTQPPPQHHDPLTHLISTLIQTAAEAGYIVETLSLHRPDRPTQPQWPNVLINGSPARYQWPPYYVQPYYSPAYPLPPQNVFWSTVLQPPEEVKRDPPPKEYVCPRCSATFKTNSNMQKHVRTVHENARPFKCDRCDASYGHKNLLVEHVRTAHDGERPFVCDTCGARFGRSSNLYSHMKSHDGKREHVCKTCHVSFSLHGNMVKHIKTVHLKQRPFACTVCNSRFGLRSDLTRHTRNVHGIVDASKPTRTRGSAIASASISASASANGSGSANGGDKTEGDKANPMDEE